MTEKEINPPSIYISSVFILLVVHTSWLVFLHSLKRWLFFSTCWILNPNSEVISDYLIHKYILVL